MASPLSLLLLVFFLPLSTPKTSPFEIEALQSLKQSIDPTSIPPGSCLSSWNFASDPCDSIFSQSFTCGIRCDAHSSDLNLSHVTDITLDAAGYSSASSLHSSLLSSLPFLQTLDLVDNRFSGHFPPPPPSSQLRRLSLSRNYFSGEIPNLPPTLTEIYLDGNLFTGSLDSLANLKQLQRLEAQSNNLTGEIPDMSSLSNLNYFYASDNFLSGKFPTNLPPSLVEITLRNNQLDGELPRSAIADLENLQVMDLSHNRLTGAVPKELFEHPSLEQLTLEYNRLEWVEEPGDGGFRSQLVEVDLGHNGLTGLLPGFIGLMPRLSAVDLEDNKFTGMIPVQYAMRAVGDSGLQFGRLLLSGNYLFGPIPSPLLGGLKEGNGEVSLADNCLFRCPSVFFFCEGGVQKAPSTCKEFNPVIP